MTVVEAMLRVAVQKDENVGLGSGRAVQAVGDTGELSVADDDLQQGCQDDMITAEKRQKRR